MPPRPLVTRWATWRVLLTVLVDLVAVTSAYAIAGAATRQVALLTPFDRRVLITIPGWLVVFLAFGLYKRESIVEPILPIPAILGAVTVSMFCLVMVIFSTHLELARSFVAVIWITSASTVIAGRLLMLLLVHMLDGMGSNGLRPAGS